MMREKLATGVEFRMSSSAGRRRAFLVPALAPI
jgi:hypothetical protein